MKNYVKLAAKRLIVNVASTHGLAPLSIISLHEFSQIQNSHNSAAFFSACLYAYKNGTYINSINKFINKEKDYPITSEQFELIVEQFKDSRYYFLYDIINNFYFKSYKDLFVLNKKAPWFNYAPLNTRILEVSVEDSVQHKKDKVSIKEQLVLDGIEHVKQPSIVLPTPQEIEATTSDTQSSVYEKPIKWTKQQSEALALVYKWLKSSDNKQIFRLFGHAGVGKTFLAKQVRNFIMENSGKGNIGSGGVLFAAFSGKAASVLRRNGCRDASTIHSLLYKAVVNADTGKCTGFTLNKQSPLKHAALLIVDEVSMVNEEMAQHLMSFGTRILVLGDPEQLKPIKGEGFFINALPDYMLTDIRRQAKDNPIIYLSTRVRENKSLKPGKYGSSRVYDSGAYISSDKLAEYSQIIVGLNATRKSMNIRMRKQNGRYDKDPMFPVKGDRLICLKNNKEAGLYNGTMWTSSNIEVRKIMQAKYKDSTTLVQGKQDILFFKVRSQDEYDPSSKELIILETQVSPHLFNPGLPEPHYRDIAGCDEFDYGYAATCHKFQGSQAYSIYIQDESSVFRDQARSWLYTAITRGEEYVTVQLQ